MQPTYRRFPERYSEEEFLPLAYRAMYFGRHVDDIMIDLFRRGVVKGTVTLEAGNEATAVGMALPLRPGRDVISFLHRDMIGHLLQGVPLCDILCQYMANARSMTHGREGNVHYGDAAHRRFPMMSHLGSMLSLVVGGTWAARRGGDDALGLAVIGDGGTNTGDFHESLNLASVRKSPVLFLVQNNYYAFSTPIREQFRCAHLSDRAAGYGIPGRTIDGTDVWQVYCAVCDALDQMHATGLPFLLECMTLRLRGHAAYDKADYVSAEENAAWQAADPLGRSRKDLSRRSGWDEARIAALEQEVNQEVDAAVAAACAVGRLPAPSGPAPVFAPATVSKARPFKAAAATNQTAVTMALDYLLSENPQAFVAGLDVAAYGSAFKTCKGLFERHGGQRVINMPISESAICGFALGAAQAGTRPIVEFQFADFITEALTQVGLNYGTWYFRTGVAAPLLLRLPCGGGVTLGAFHSGEFEGLLSRFMGLKLLYPATPQEMFEALVAGFHDPNPCVVFEHKLLYTRAKGAIDFDGDLTAAWRPRRHREGTQVTVVAMGAMVEASLTAAQRSGISADVWNPFCLSPLQLGPVEESLKRTGRLLVVQEASETAGLADRIVSLLARSRAARLQRQPVVVASPDTPVPFAPELESVHRPDAERIAGAMTQLCQD